MRLRGKILAVLAVVVVAGAVVVAALPKPVVVDVAAVVEEPMLVTLDLDGTLRMRHRAVLSTPVSGNLIHPTARPGDPVVEGQVLARVEPLPTPLLSAAGRAEVAAQVRTAEAAVDQARAAVARIDAARENAAAQADRAKKVAESGAGAKTAVDDARAVVRALTHELAGARFGVRLAEEQLALARASQRRALGESGGPLLELKAPIAGVVLAVLVESDGVVAAGTPVIELGDPSSVEVWAPVLTADAATVRVGAPVEIAVGDVRAPGVVSVIEPKAWTHLSALGVEEQRTRVIIDVDEATTHEATIPRGDGWSVRVAITQWEGARVVQVPAGALVRDGATWSAFVVEEGRAVRRPVEIGHRAGGRVEVRTGLSAGDAVVVYPSEDVQDGARVSVPAAGGLAP